MRKVSHVVPGAVLECKEQFYGAIPHDEVLRSDRNGREQEHQLRIGKQHAKGEQQPKHGTAGAHHPSVHNLNDPRLLKWAGVGRHELLHSGKKGAIVRIELQSHHKLVQGERPEPTNDIVRQETLGAPNAFQLGPKHEQRKHVEENVTQIPMHEHVGHHLPGLEKRGARVRPCQQRHSGVSHQS